MRMQKRLRRGFERFSWASKIAEKTKKILSLTKPKSKQKREKLFKLIRKRVEFIARGKTKKRGKLQNRPNMGKFGKPKKKGPMRTRVLIWWVISPEKKSSGSRAYFGLIHSLSLSFHPPRWIETKNEQ